MNARANDLDRPDAVATAVAKAYKKQAMYARRFAPLNALRMLHYIETAERPTFTGMADHFDVNPATVRRRYDAMRKQLGVLIDYNPATKTIRVADWGVLSRTRTLVHINALIHNGVLS